MNMHTPQSLPDAEVFSGTRPISLAEVMARVEAGLTGTTRRDTLSAFRVLAEQGQGRSGRHAGHGSAVREVLASLSAASLGVTPKRLANIRSLITTAVERFGSRRFWITREITPDEHWQTLLGIGSEARVSMEPQPPRLLLHGKGDIAPRRSAPTRCSACMRRSRQNACRRRRARS